jgi:hypothetical protein
MQDDAWRALMRALLAERFGPLRRTARERPDTPAQAARRRRALREVMGEEERDR